jgi:Na+-translocating ferredoxin:NAD+ oxidoreductase subunit G
MNTIPLNLPQEPSSQRLIISMAVAGFISGVIIIAIYILTFDTIKENKAQELQRAVFKVLPGVTKMQKLHYQANKLIVVKTDEVDEEMVFAGYDNQGNFLGYAIQGAGPGFQDTIKLLFGYQRENSIIVGMEILDSRETPGLGDKIFKDMDFVNEFKKLIIESEIKSIKKGKKTQENEVDSITGATISSKAVVRIINQAYQKWIKKLPKIGYEPRWQENKKQVIEKTQQQLSNNKVKSDDNRK